MEGVIVGAKRAGSPITISVVSDRQGQYRFPKAKLEPGQYTLRITAVGYDLDGSASVEVAPQQTATANLTLRKTKNLASQLSNTEWLMSVPGTDAQKAGLRACSHCHTLERIVRSRHTAQEFIAVQERMSHYP